MDGTGRHTCMRSVSMQRNGQGRFKSKQEGEYDGCWENDLRHGFGKLKYPNGDYYEGGWELNRVS